MALSNVISRIAHEAYRQSPSTMPSQPWWDNLESNFCDRPTGFELESWDALRVKATAFVDTLLRTSAATLVGTTAMPLGYHPLAIRRMLNMMPLYESLANTHDPQAFFAEPPSGITVHHSKVRGLHYRPKDGVCEHLTFASPYVPVHPDMRKAWQKQKNNNKAHARFWRHDSGPRPVICAIHGFGADPYWLNEWFFALPWFYRMGYDVLLFTLPFHGARQSNHSLFSGHGFFSGGFGRLNEAFGQAVMDFRIFRRWLRDEYGVDRLGVTGISLGGYTTALLAAVEKDLSFAIPNVPVVSLPDLMLEWQPVGALLRPILASAGMSIKDLRRFSAVHCPLTYKPLLPRDRLMVIGGVGDRLAPPKHARILWDHWGRCRIHWFPGNHVIHLDKGEYLKHIVRFLDQIGFGDPHQL